MVLNFLISYDLEHWGAIKSEHSRLAKQTLSNWWFHSVQISSMDAKTSFLYGSLGKCSYKAFDTQMAWVIGFDHLSLPSHPRNDEDGDHKNWWREGWASPRGNTIVWIYINKRITLLIFLYGTHLIFTQTFFSGCNQLSNIANVFNQNDGKTNHDGPITPRCREYGGKNNQSNCHIQTIST